VGVAAAVGVLPAVAVAVPVAIAVAVPAVTLVGAPSSRKMIKGLPHQCSFASPKCDGVEVAPGFAGVPPPKLKHETRKKLDKSRNIARYKHIRCRRTTRDKE